MYQLGFGGGKVRPGGFLGDLMPTVQGVGPIVEEIARAHPELAVLKLDVDANPRAAARFGVQAIPTLILFAGGEPVERLVGFHPKEELVARLRPHLSGRAQETRANAKHARNPD